MNDTQLTTKTDSTETESDTNTTAPGRAAVTGSAGRRLFIERDEVESQDTGNGCSISDGQGSPCPAPLVKGGQGRSGDELVSVAMVFSTVFLIGVLMLLANVIYESWMQ